MEVKHEPIELGDVTNDMNQSADVALHVEDAFRPGLERQIVPAGNSDRIVTKPMSALFFVPSG
ncbi:MAG TPA: hypothetical protein PKD12_12720 [Nitrospira sp.]|nr:hypothetical protein [Nitrospira sp.]